MKWIANTLRQHSKKKGLDREKKKVRKRVATTDTLERSVVNLRLANKCPHSWKAVSESIKRSIGKNFSNSRTATHKIGKEIFKEATNGYGPPTNHINMYCNVATIYSYLKHRKFSSFPSINKLHINSKQATHTNATLVQLKATWIEASHNSSKSI